MIHTSANVLVLFLLTVAGTLALFYLFVIMSRAALLTLIASFSFPFIRTKVWRPCLYRMKRIAWARCRAFTLCVMCGGLFDESYRGRFIISGRQLLLLDVLVSVTVGAVIDASAAIVRISMALGFGLLRAALIVQPVVPPRLASLDTGFSFYGAMLKARHAALLDPSHLPPDY